MTEDPRAAAQTHQKSVFAGKNCLSALEVAIYSTVAYRDMFNAPVTVAEVHRYLHSEKATLADVEDALANGTLVPGWLISRDGYFALKGREEVISTVRQRRDCSEAVWQRAAGLLKVLAHMPFVRMIGVTGSLAAGNQKTTDDFDIMCVTETGKLWRARSILLVLRAIEVRTLRLNLCPNLFFSQRALELPVRSLFLAQELAQMVPVHGQETYNTLRTANLWTEAYLPNAIGPPPDPSVGQIAVQKWIKKPLEWGAGWPFGDWLERFEARRKITRFNSERAGSPKGTGYSTDSTTLNLDVADKIEKRWRDRLEDAGLPEPPMPKRMWRSGSHRSLPPAPCQVGAPESLLSPE